MSSGRPDLSSAGYKNGLRLSCGVLPDSHVPELGHKSTPTEMTQHNSVKEFFWKAKLLLEAITEDGRPLDYIPREILVNHVSVVLNSITLKAISVDGGVGAPLTESHSFAHSEYWNECIGYFSVDQQSSDDDKLLEFKYKKKILKTVSSLYVLSLTT
jgi:hypothetical protein